MLALLARRAGHPPDRAARRHLLAAQLRCGTAPVPGDERAGVDDRRRGRGAGPGQARVRGRARRPHDRADDQQAVPRRAGHRQARARPRRRSPSAARASPPSPSTPPRSALGDLTERHVLHHRRGRDGRADRPGAARPRRHDDVRRQPPPRAGDRARPAVRRRLGLVRRSARRAGARGHRDLLDLLAAHAARRRGARAGGQASGAAARCCSSTSPCRATSSTAAPSCRASRCSTSTACRQQVARHISVRKAEARRAEGIVEEEIQAFAGWLGSLEVLPTLTALRARGDAGRRPGAGRERAAAGRRSPSATASAWRRSPRRSPSACCTSRRCA